MDLKCVLPGDIERKMSTVIGGEEILYSLASDLTLDREFGKSYIVVTRSTVAVCDASNDARAAAVSEIREVRIDELFGGARLVAVLPGGERSLIYYSKVHVPEFAVLSRVISDMAAGRPVEVPDEQFAAYCAKCGSPLPERGSNCPLCVPRWEVMRRLMGLVRPYRGKAIILMAATVVGVGAEMLPPYLTKLIVDDVIKGEKSERLVPLIAVMVACGLLVLGAGYVRYALSCWLALRVVADLRDRLHAHLQRLHMRYLNRHDSGELVARVMHDTGELLAFLVEGLPFLLVNSIMFVTIAIILLCLDAKLALLVFLPVPFLIFGGGWFWNRLIPLFHKRGSRLGLLHSILNESISGVKAVKAACMEDRRAGTFSGSNEELFRANYDIERTFVGFFQVTFWIMSLGVTAVWFYAARRMLGGDSALTIGDLWAFVLYMTMFYGPLRWFTTIFNWMSHAFSGAERIFGVLDSAPETYDAPDAISLPEMKGRIEFRDVRFSYERGKEVIKGVSFEIAAGEMVGLVGKSGAGKSTIINLVCRFFETDSGVITIDGHPINKLKLADLRSQIGIVMQEPFLFNATIFENIRCTKTAASFDEVVRAARAANAHEFIIDKEDGYDTVIGQGGITLSGGEKQRVAIARAILHDPPILILDEATSSVDSETESAIQEAIANLVRNRTTIAIAHRLATLRHANRLVVIEDGKIAETGTHDELCAHDGIYAKLVKMQTELNRLRATAWED